MARGTGAGTGTARSRRMISHPARKKFKPHVPQAYKRDAVRRLRVLR
jgi:hypothetical protein